MKKLFLFLMLLIPISASATTTVTGTLQNLGTATVGSASFVRFWLRGCGGNQPRISGVAMIAPSQGGVFFVDFVANGSGVISGTLYSTRDSTGLLGGEIECGGSHLSVWYGMQIFVGGKGGPEVPIHAKNGVTLDITQVVPISVTPAPAAPGGGGGIPGGASGQVQFNNAGVFGGIPGSSVTAGTGATTLTASADTVTPVTLFGHSATQSVPVFNAFSNTTAALRATFNFLGQAQGAFPNQGGTTVPVTMFVSAPNKATDPIPSTDGFQIVTGADGDTNDFFGIYTFSDLTSLNHGTEFSVTNDGGNTNDFLEFVDNSGTGIRALTASIDDNTGTPYSQLQEASISPLNNTISLTAFNGSTPTSVTLDSLTGHITNVGALTSTATTDAVTPVTLIAHSATQSVPMQIFDVKGSGGNSNVLRFKDSTAGGSPQGNIDFAPGNLTVSGSNTAGTAFGSFVVDTTANLELTATNLIGWQNNTSFAFNGGINTSTGEIMAGYVPTTQAGFFSIVDGPRTHKISITNPGTVAANYNFALPITAGSAGQPLISEAGGTTPMQWGAISGTGSFCLTTSCVMTTPNLGTPSAATLTNATGLPFSGIASGTNTTAAMLVGTGASLGTSGTGTINATTLGGVTFPVPIGSTTCGTCPILNPTINVDQGMIQLSLGTGYLNLATKPFSIEAAGNYTTTAASAPALNFEVQLCTVSLCGSGTVVDLIDITTTTLSATALSNATWTISATCVINATGATGNLVCKGSPGLTLDTGASIVTPDSTFADTNTATSGNIDLTAALFLRFTVAQSVAGASNSYTQTLASIR